MGVPNLGHLARSCSAEALVQRAAASSPVNGTSGSCDMFWARGEKGELGVVLESRLLPRSSVIAATRSLGDGWWAKTPWPEGSPPTKLTKPCGL